MSGLEAVDWYCVAPGWLAVYRKERKNLMRKEAREERYKEAYNKALADIKAEAMTDDTAKLADWQILQAEAIAQKAADLTEAQYRETPQLEKAYLRL